MHPDSFPSAIPKDDRGSMQEVPIAEEVREPLIAFWEDMFGVSFTELRPIMCGEEQSARRDFVWRVWKANQPQATCHLTIARAQPILGGLGEVATSTDSRGRGLATSLCRKAKSTFQKYGGQALPRDSQPNGRADVSTFGLAVNIRCKCNCLADVSRLSHRVL